MPFDSITAAEGGRKGGGKRWRDKDPDTNRSKLISMKLSPGELEQMDEKAKRLGLKRTQLILRAVEAYPESLEFE